MLGALYGLTMSGYDNLGWHSYRLSVQYNTLRKVPSFAVFYINSQLAPWRTQVALSQSVDEFMPFLQRDGRLRLSRPLWTSEVAVGLSGVQVVPNRALNADFTPWYAAGPSLAVSYAATESTPYGGAVRGLIVSTGVDYLPSALTWRGSLLHLQQDITTIVPTPWSTRHSVRLDLHGRAILGDTLLRLGQGGMPSVLGSWEHAVDSPSKPLPVDRGWRELVLGFEDTSWNVTRTLNATMRYRAPFIIDYGWHSLFYLLPGPFVRQVDTELFAVATLSDARQRLHRALGASASVQVLWFNAPVRATYQFAYRFDGVRRPPFHLLLLSLG